MRKKLGQYIYDKIHKLHDELMSLKGDEAIERAFDIDEQIKLMADVQAWMLREQILEIDDWRKLVNRYNSEFSYGLDKFMKNCNKVWADVRPMLLSK